MYLTGLADEAAQMIDGQIIATKELGWKYIESRNISGSNIIDISDADFDLVCEKLDAASIKINCFGSAIANWAKQITDPHETSFEEIRKALPRMQKLGTTLIRIMSYAVLENRAPDNQMENERFKKLREIKKIFDDAGIVAVHENCMNYGGMGWIYTLRLVENVPGLRLVFDTGNPVFIDDRNKPQPWPKQSSWDFYKNVKEHISYVHIKDGIWHENEKYCEYTFPGEGNGDVLKIVKDMLNDGYDGGFSIEPHMAVTFHDASKVASEKTMSENYIRYGRKFEQLLKKAKQLNA